MQGRRLTVLVDPQGNQRIEYPPTKRLEEQVLETLWKPFPSEVRTPDLTAVIDRLATIDFVYRRNRIDTLINPSTVLQEDDSIRSMPAAVNSLVETFDLARYYAAVDVMSSVQAAQSQIDTSDPRVIEQLWQSARTQLDGAMDSARGPEERTLLHLPQATHDLKFKDVSYSLDQGIVEDRPWWKSYRVWGGGVVAALALAFVATTSVRPSLTEKDIIQQYRQSAPPMLLPLGIHLSDGETSKRVGDFERQEYLERIREFHPGMVPFAQALISDKDNVRRVWERLHESSRHSVEEAIQAGFFPETAKDYRFVTNFSQYRQENETQICFTAGEPFSDIQTSWREDGTLQVGAPVYFKLMIKKPPSMSDQDFATIRLHSLATTEDSLVYLAGLDRSRKVNQKEWCDFTALRATHAYYSVLASRIFMHDQGFLDPTFNPQQSYESLMRYVSGLSNLRFENPFLEDYRAKLEAHGRFLMEPNDQVRRIMDQRRIPQ